MTWDEYNKLFHKTQANLVAFQPLVQCDHEVIRMIEAAVAEEREACAKVCDEHKNPIDDPLAPIGTYESGKYVIAEFLADAIRARGQA